MKKIINRIIKMFSNRVKTNDINIDRVNNKVFKINGKYCIDPKYLDLIRRVAEELGLYEKRVPDVVQCSGYFIFRDLCLNNEDLGEDTKLLSIHPVMRKQMMEAIMAIRYKIRAISENKNRNKNNKYSDLNIYRAKEFLTPQNCIKYV